MVGFARAARGFVCGAVTRMVGSAVVFDCSGGGEALAGGVCAEALTQSGPSIRSAPAQPLLRRVAVKTRKKDIARGTPGGTSPRTKSPRTSKSDDWFANRQYSPTSVLARDHG